MAHLSPTPTLEVGQDRTMILNMGPHHPSTHGVLRLILEIDGETIVRIMPDIGYLHTGIEKTCEAKFYQQVVPLTDRIDYLCPLTNNLCYVLAVEKLLGLEIPERAQTIRVLTCAAAVAALVLSASARSHAWSLSLGTLMLADALSATTGCSARTKTASPSSTVISTTTRSSLPPCSTSSRMSSTSRPSAVKYPASLAIQVVAQLAAKLGYKSRMEIVAARPSDETAMNKIRNVSSRISLKSIFYPLVIAQRFTSRA